MHLCNLTFGFYTQKQKLLIMRLDVRGGIYHGFVVKRKSLHGSQGIGGTINLFKNNKGLTLHLHALCNQNVQDLSELGEYSVQRLLQLCWNIKPVKTWICKPLHAMLTWAEAYLPSFLIFSFKLLMYIVWFRRTSGVVIFYKAAKGKKQLI